jgi:hypothetical protein
VTYAKRVIELTFQLGTGSLGEAGANQLTISGLRCFVQVSHVTLPATGPAQIRVYGLTLDHINALTQAGRLWEPRHNTIAIAAGDAGGQLATIFNGEIYSASPDFSELPDSAFVILAAGGGAKIQLAPAPPVSFGGSVTLKTALTQILQPIGATLEDNGGAGSATLASPYFPGTVWQQVNRAVEASDVVATYDQGRNVLAIWPKGGARSGAAVELSSETGMISTPEFMRNFIRVRMQFAPNYIVRGPGAQVRVKSQLAGAAGLWAPTRVDYNLASEVPNGPWEMVVEGAPLGVR